MSQRKGSYLLGRFRRTAQLSVRSLVGGISTAASAKDWIWIGIMAVLFAGTVATVVRAFVRRHEVHPMGEGTGPDDSAAAPGLPTLRPLALGEGCGEKRRQQSSRYRKAPEVSPLMKAPGSPGSNGDRLAGSRRRYPLDRSMVLEHSQKQGAARSTDPYGNPPRVKRIVRSPCYIQGLLLRRYS